MASVTPQNDQNIVPGQQHTAVALQAVVILVAGMIAAWVAAGSTGLLGHPLQHALTWLALAVAIVAAWPKEKPPAGTWAILAGGALFGLVFTASALPAVNVLAVAVMLAAIAQVNRGLTSRVSLIVALAAGGLGLSRFACDSIAIYWLAADLKGWIFGRIAGWLVGNRLEVGITFGGLDFLFLMVAIYAGWLICTAPPRRHRAIWARGFRNAFSFDVDPRSGRIFVNDVGASTTEEIDEAVAGGNYGWPLFEGPGGGAAFRQPVYSYHHDAGCAVTGAAFFAPKQTTFPREWIGRYFFGEYCWNEIRWLDPDRPAQHGRDGGADNRFSESMRSSLIQKMNWTLESR